MDRIKRLKIEYNQQAIEIFSAAFAEDPLFLFAFPEIELRKRLTKLMYEFVVNDMVTALNLTLNGYFIDNVLAGCCIYTTPESSGWNDKMNDSIMLMRKKANDACGDEGAKRINLIGEYARLEGYAPGVEYFYGNELAVRNDFRKKGIGKGLTEFMWEECKAHPDANGVLLDTVNENNVKLYEKWGWELKKEVNFHTLKKYFMWRGK